MKGEFDSPSHPASEAYREGWERIYQAVNLKMWYPAETPAIPVLSSNNCYKSGCPILDEDIGTDQANGSPA